MRRLHFIIGTQAELMKLFPVINAAKDRGFETRIISTGQNDLVSCPYLERARSVVDMDIRANTAKKKDASNYLGWFVGTARNGRKLLGEYFTDEMRSESLCVVHGDTLTTTMGAWMCKKLKLPYAHIESGLRSFNFLSPFPEEFDRLYGSSYSVMNFCPGKIHADYAQKRFKGQAVDTVYNTGIETLYDAVERIGDTRHPQQPSCPYFMFMLHRQENIMSADFVRRVAEKIMTMADAMACVFIYHEQTRAKMQEFGVFDDIAKHPNITLLPRQEYLDFVRLVLQTEFIATDGCGNQQEFYYLGKPYLILRTSVEKDTEGLGWNAKVFDNDFDGIPDFLGEYHNYTKPRVVPEVSPSKIIVDSVERWFDERERVRLV